MGGLLDLPSFVRDTESRKWNPRLMAHSQVKVFPQIDLTESGEAGLDANQKLHKSVIQGLWSRMFMLPCPS